MPTTYISQHKTIWGNHARQDIGVAGATFEGGLYTDMGVGGVAAYRADGGGAFASVSTAGTYSVAPTYTVTANGYTSGRANGAGTISLSGGGLGATTPTNLGKAMIPTPTANFVGGTGSGGALTVTLEGNTLQARFTGVSGAFGAAPLALYAAGLIGQTQRGIATGILGASTDKLALVFRVNLSSNSHISINFTATKTQIWLMKNGYNGAGTGTATLLGDTGTITSPGIGQGYSVDATVESTSTTTTTITVVVTNTTTGVVLGSVTRTTSDVEVQAAGRVGIGFTGSTVMSMSTVEWLNAKGVVACDISSIPASSTGIANITGAATRFDLFPPTVSGATLNSITVVDATHATLNITAGPAAGLMYILDSEPGSSQFITLNITGISVPTITRSLPTLVGAQLDYGSGATGGSAPYKAQMKSAVLSAQIPNGTGIRNVGSQQTGVGEGVAFTSVVDTLASYGLNFYVAEVEDNNGNKAYTQQTQSVVLRPYSGPVAIFLGDSITEGFNAGTVFNKGLTRGDVSTPGSGYTSELAWAVSDVPCLRKAVVGGSIRSGGQVKGIWFSDRGDGYTSGNLPTITGSGGGGSGVVIGAPNLGGGHVKAVELVLSVISGGYYIPLLDLGVAGSQAANFLPIGTTAGNYTNNVYYFYELAKAAAAASSNPVRLWVLGHGINDSNIFHQVGAANYMAQVKATANDILSIHPENKVLFKIPTIPNMAVYAGTDAPSILRLQQYIVQINVAFADYATSNPGRVFVMPDWFPLFAGNLDLLDTDGLHPGPWGHGVMAAIMAQKIAEILRLTVGPRGIVPPGLMVGG